MATATVLSSMVVQKQEKRFAYLWPSFSRSAPCYRFCQNGPLCSIPQHPHIQSEADAPRRTPSRRDTIALFLHTALLSATNSSAQAAESGFEREKGFEHVQFKNELDMKVSVDVSAVPELMPKLPLGKLAGFVLAFQGAQKSSGSSLGFLGCLVFGLLFLKEKNSRAANNASLEDIEVRMKQAEAELCSQTRSSVRYKLEETQLENGNGRDTSLNEALQRQLLDAKTSIAERGTQLDVKKDLSELFRNHATGLTASVKEIEKDCIALLGCVDKQLNVQRELEAELQSMVMDLLCKAEKISSLKASVENQEEANNEMMEKLVVVESSLDKSNKQVLDAEKNVESLENCLLATDGSVESSAKDLRLTGTRNETLEGELNELLNRLHNERAAFVRHLAEQNELLNRKGNEVDARSAELLSEQDELERDLRIVNQLTHERDELVMAVSEKRTTSDDLTEVLDLNQERLRIVKNELATLHEQLFHEQARSTALESDLKNNEVLGLLSKASLHVENQINSEKDMTERLEKELHIANRALSESKVETSALQDMTQALQSSQARLQEDMARLNEEQQAINRALKKEKRAAAYAKKQLALSKEIISEESRVMEELCNELEKVRRLNEDSKEQILVKASELERAIETELHLTDDAFQLKSNLNEERTLQINLGGSDEVLTSVGKPMRRRNITKQTTPKTQKSSKKSPVQPSQCKGK